MKTEKNDERKNHQISIEKPTRSEAIRRISGLNRTQFSKKYNIPLRSLEHWDAGDREPADYVFDLLERAVREDFDN